MKDHENGHTWEAIAIFEEEIVNGCKEPRPILYIKCRNCADNRILIGTNLPKG
jgi:hypothetical protein